MVAPIIYGIGALAVRAAPAILEALPAIGRGAFWLVKQPFTNTVRTAAVVGGAHYATDGASSRLALATGEVAAKGVGLVVGKDNVEAAGHAALSAGTKITQGLAGAGATVVNRYGPEIVSEVKDAVPLGRISLATKAISEGAHEKISDLREGGIKVPDAIRPSGAFKERAQDVAEEAQDAFGGLLNKAELARFGALAKQDATTNKFIQAALLLGGIQGLRSDGNVGEKAFKATTNALMLAMIFGAIGHYMFGQKSALIEAASDTLSGKFGNAANNNEPAAPAVAAPAPAYAAPIIRSQRPPLMTPALSMG